MESIEGIVLKVIPYGERGQIVQMLSLDRGRISALLPGRLAQKVHTEPFSCSQFVMKSGRGAMYRCQDVTLLESNLNLRERFEVMEAGGSMVRILLKTQYPDRPCEVLYASLKHFLRALPKSTLPKNYGLAFALKLLRHECMLDEEPALPSKELFALQTLLNASAFSALDSVQLEGSTIKGLEQYISNILSHH